MSDEPDWEDATHSHPLMPDDEQEPGQGDLQDEALDQRSPSLNEDTPGSRRSQKHAAVVESHSLSDLFGGDDMQSHRIVGLSLFLVGRAGDKKQSEEDNPGSQRDGEKAGFELRLAIGSQESSPASKRNGDESSRDSKSKTHQSDSAFEADKETDQTDNRGVTNAPKTAKNLQATLTANFQAHLELEDHNKPKPVFSEKFGIKMKTTTEGSGWNKHTERHIDVMGGIKNLFSKKKKGPDSKKQDKKSNSQSTSKAKPEQNIEMQEIKQKGK